MEVLIPVFTVAGPGEILFDMEEGSAMIGELKRVDIPDQAARDRFDRYTEYGNPELVLKIGGSEAPANPKEHLDCIIRICERMMDDGIEGFDYIPPTLDTGPSGDAWR